MVPAAGPEPAAGICAAAIMELAPNTIHIATVRTPMTHLV